MSDPSSGPGSDEEVGLGFGDGLGFAVGLGLGFGDGLGFGVGLGLGFAVGVGLGLGFGDGLGFAVGLAGGSTVGLGVDLDVRRRVELGAGSAVDDVLDDILDDELNDVLDDVRDLLDDERDELADSACGVLEVDTRVRVGRAGLACVPSVAERLVVVVSEVVGVAEAVDVVRSSRADEAARVVVPCRPGDGAGAPPVGERAPGSGAAVGAVLASDSSSKPAAEEVTGGASIAVDRSTLVSGAGLTIS